MRMFTTFDANLRKFVNETRAKGGIPVLFNSIVRRNFGTADNKAVAEAILQDDIRKGINPDVRSKGRCLSRTRCFRFCNGLK